MLVIDQATEAARARSRATRKPLVVLGFGVLAGGVVDRVDWTGARGRVVRVLVVRVVMIQLHRLVWVSVSHLKKNYRKGRAKTSSLLRTTSRRHRKMFSVKNLRF